MVGSTTLLIAVSLLVSLLAIVGANFSARRRRVARRETGQGGVPGSGAVDVPGAGTNGGRRQRDTADRQRAPARDPVVSDGGVVRQSRNSLGGDGPITPDDVPTRPDPPADAETVVRSGGDSPRCADAETDLEGSRGRFRCADLETVVKRDPGSADAGDVEQGPGSVDPADMETVVRRRSGADDYREMETVVREPSQDPDPADMETVIREVPAAEGRVDDGTGDEEVAVAGPDDGGEADGVDFTDLETVAEDVADDGGESPPTADPTTPESDAADDLFYFVTDPEDAANPGAVDGFVDTFVRPDAGESDGTVQSDTTLADGDASRGDGDASPADADASRGDGDASPADADRESDPFEYVDPVARGD